MRALFIFLLSLAACRIEAAAAAAPAAATAPAVVVSAAPGLKGLDAAIGQTRLRMAPLADGRVVAVYAQGYARDCGLLGLCKNHPEVWHLVFDRKGVVVPPARTVPDWDELDGLNSTTFAPGVGAGVAYDGGRSVLFAMAHSSHNKLSGRFVRIDGEGKVLARVGGEGSYTQAVCALGRDVVVDSYWVDPVTSGYAWYGAGHRLEAVVNLGGYGYNYEGRSDLVCGSSRALGSPYALMLRKDLRSHIGLSLYRVPGKRWSLVGEEAKLPLSRLLVARSQWAGGLAVGDDRGVVLFLDGAPDGRRNLFYARFRLTSRGIVLVDKASRTLPTSPAFEGLDGAVTYGNDGRFYIALYQAGDSAAGLPRNRRQAIRLYSLDFDSDALRELATLHEDARWSGRPPLTYYGMSQNMESFSVVKSCDGNLYVGAPIDGGQGPHS